MMKQQPVDLDAHPPFTGFPPEGLKFLRELKKHNDREWFAAHKEEYLEYVKYPMQSLIAALAAPIGAIAPGMSVDPKTSMFRIHRDTRFSGNKDPYKTHVAAIFHPPGRWTESAALYLHVEPGKVFLAGGVYMPDGAQLKKIRAAIAAKPEEFLGVVNDPAFRKKFGPLDGDRLSRAPLGFRPDHPMIGWLRFKQFIVHREWDESAARRKDLPARVASVYRDMMPLVRFLNRALHK